MVDVGKSSNLSQIEEEMNFTISKLQSLEIKESIRINESNNILPLIKNSTEIKPPESNFKKAYENEKNNEKLEEIDENAKKQEKSQENEKNNENDEKNKNINIEPMLIINNGSNRVTEEKSLVISANKEENKENLIIEDEENKNLGKYLNFVKKNRKQVNLEAQILANRIALLKQEELKTLKKIKETKNKADEIYRLKKQNHERSLERANQLKLTKELIYSKVNSKKQVREQQKDEKDNFRVTYQLHKQQEMTSIRKESQRNQAIKTLYDKKYMENNSLKANFIRKQLMVGNMKVEEFKTNKILRCKKEYERKISEEKDITKKSEMDIMEMEKMELELIRKLQQSQYIQKTVYEELEGALTLPLIEFENKYKINDNDNNTKKRKKTKKKKESVNSIKMKLNGFKF